VVSAVKNGLNIYFSEERDFQSQEIESIMFEASG
jgi:hypothetical protein